MIYEGYIGLHAYPTTRGTFGFMFKVLDINPGIYCVEFPVRGASALVLPLKYSKHIRKDRRAGGDSGAFKIPQVFLRTLMTWGIQPGYVYVRVWKIV